MLAAGNFDFPANSLLTASVASYAKRKPQPKWSHTEQQVHALHEWFRKHQVGWSVSQVTFVAINLVTLAYVGDVRFNIYVLLGGHVNKNTPDHQFI